MNQFDCCCDRCGSTTAVIYIILCCRVEGEHLVRVKPTDDLGVLRTRDPVGLRLLEGRELVLASGVLLRHVCGSQVSSVGAVFACSAGRVRP